MPGFIDEGRINKKAPVDLIIAKLEPAYLALDDSIAKIRRLDKSYEWAAKSAMECRSQLSRVITGIKLQSPD